MKTHKDDQEQYELMEFCNRFLKPKTILELGCGEGRLRPIFERQRYCGIDIRHHPLVDAIMDIRNPAIGEKFDLVFSCTALMHIEKIDLKAIANLSQKFVVFIETRRKLKRAFKHDYQQLEEDGFNLSIRINLKTRNSPLTLWMFERRTSNENPKQDPLRNHRPEETLHRLHQAK